MTALQGLLLHYQRVAERCHNCFRLSISRKMEFMRTRRDTSFQEGSLSRVVFIAYEAFTLRECTYEAVRSVDCER